jgi:exopolyphosphatase/guanosine-5'-triphosphate,3'-diphosphate pyrophosphatase
MDRSSFRTGMRHAVIDIGTNTCLLLIAEAEDSGKIKVLTDIHAIARLGAGVDRSKVIQEDAYDRLAKILLEHKKVIAQYNASSVAPIATSAMRDAENRDEIIRRIKDDCGFDIELLSGQDESHWSYRGALYGLDNALGSIGALDIGGGSTELSFGVDGKYESGKSINIGAVRVTERFLLRREPDSIEAARTYIRSEIENGFTRNISISKLIAVAGTPTALAAMKLRLEVFDAKKVNGITISKHEIDTMSEEVLSLSPTELVKKYPAVHPSRADILPAGTIILREVLEFLKMPEVEISTYGLRYGIMLRECERTSAVKES